MLLLINRRGLQINRCVVRDDRLDSHIVGDGERVVARCAAKQRHGEQVRVAAGVSADDCKHMYVSMPPPKQIVRQTNITSIYLIVGVDERERRTEANVPVQF